MDIRLRFIKGIDRKAVFPIAYLIHSFVQNHRNTGCVEIGENEITFSKAVFFTVGKISYQPYGLSCNNGIIHYDGSASFLYHNDNLFTFLVNALIQLDPGHVAKIPL